MPSRPCTAWAIVGAGFDALALPKFLFSIRAKALWVSLILLLIPFMGLKFVAQMETFLNEGQQQVLASAAKLLSASLSDRPQLLSRARASPESEEEERKRVLGWFGSDEPIVVANLGAAYQPSPEVEKILNVVAKNATRIWVLDANSQVRGLVGTLADPQKTAANSGWFSRTWSSLVNSLAPLVTRQSGIVESENLSERDRVMAQVDRALIGQHTTLRRDSADGHSPILSAAQPVWLGDNIVGAVVVEETTQGTQALSYAALETVLAATLVVFLVGFVAVLVFAWRLAFRVRAMQREADAAIDSQGRITGRIAGASAQDEVGALARTLEDMLGRLTRYNDYLEKLAARLSHELRTPVAVVRSSLDNLRDPAMPAAQRVYIERADEGVKRLSAIINRMSEATQLEGMLKDSDKENFDLSAVLRGCVEGYRSAYPRARFTLEAASSVELHGVPDAIAQALDKLIANAADFATPNTPIRLELGVDKGVRVISVENSGPLLPDKSSGALFGSMVSSRIQSGSSHIHLGLGLYIVRLIAQFHGGTARAENLADGSGVRFEIRVPGR